MPTHTGGGAALALDFEGGDRPLTRRLVTQIDHDRIGQGAVDARMSLPDPNPARVTLAVVETPARSMRS
jgi:hypothetical protein